MNIEKDISSYIRDICQSINDLDPYEYKRTGRKSIIAMIKNFYSVHILHTHKYILPYGIWLIEVNDIIKIFNIDSRTWIYDIGTNGKLYICISNIDIEK